MLYATEFMEIRFKRSMTYKVVTEKLGYFMIWTVMDDLLSLL